MENSIFTRKQIRALVIPLIIEQLLASLMGTIDTMMVSAAGSAAISAVSLVDAINVLIIHVFSARAARSSVRNIWGAATAGKRTRPAASSFCASRCFPLR